MDDDVQEAINDLKDQIAGVLDKINSLSAQLDQATQDTKEKLDAQAQTNDATTQRFQVLERYVHDFAQSLQNWPPVVLGNDTNPGVKFAIPAPPF
jgi:cell division septum initiation protein DivIVA